MRNALPSRFVAAIMELRIPHAESCASWCYRPETDYFPECNCPRAKRLKDQNALVDALTSWADRMEAAQQVWRGLLVMAGVAPAPRLLPAPWDATSGRTLLALVNHKSPGELLHAIDLIGGAVALDAVPRSIRAVSIELMKHGLLRVAGLLVRPRVVVGPYNTTSLLWELTDEGRALLASLRAARAPRFGWCDVVVDWIATEEAA